MFKKFLSSAMVVVGAVLIIAMVYIIFCVFLFQSVNADAIDDEIKAFCSDKEYVELCKKTQSASLADLKDFYQRHKNEYDDIYENIEKCLAKTVDHNENINLVKTYECVQKKYQDRKM
jgi:hypothetical protein